MRWIQNYYAAGNNIFLTAACALLPILFLFWALAVKKMKGVTSVFFAWVITVFVAVAVYRMPAGAALSAAAFGAAQGMFPLCWMVLNAVFLYNLIVRSGNFEIIGSSIASVTNDRRIQAILIGFCFSAFLEGTTSMGAPVAIAASMLIGLGFPVLPAAVICLVANTIPVPFGSAGLGAITTVTTAFGGESSGVIAAAIRAVTASVGGIMCVYALITPVFMLVVMCGRKAAREVLPVCIIAGTGYFIPNFFITRYMGPELPSLLSPLVSLAALVAFLKVWKPKTVWRFEGDAPAASGVRQGYGPGSIARAWTPFILLTLLMAAWPLPAFRTLFANIPCKITAVPWPGLHGIVYRAAPIVPEPSLYAAAFTFDLAGATGTAIFVTAILTALIFRMKITAFGEVFLATFKQLKFALLTMTLVLSIAHLSNYSGISYTLGLAFAATGPFFIVFSPLIGFTGVFLTGSVTSSGALFGSLQRVSAEQLGLNPLVTITAGIVGAVMGKLVSPQSIAIGAAATGLVGQEGAILHKTVKYAFMLLGMGIVIIVLLTCLFPGYF